MIYSADSRQHAADAFRGSGPVGDEVRGNYAVSDHPVVPPDSGPTEAGHSGGQYHIFTQPLIVCCLKLANDWFMLVTRILHTRTCH